MDWISLRPWLIIGAVVLLVALMHYGFYRVLRGDKSMVREFFTFGKAAQGGQRAQEKQNADLDELHKRVAELTNKPE
jgi:type VI protein secretion system component VasK